MRPSIEDKVKLHDGYGPTLYFWSDGVVTWKRSRADLDDVPDMEDLVCICGLSANDPNPVYIAGCPLHGSSIPKELP